MLPDAYGQPSCFLESRVGISVSSNVPSDLLRPIVLVRSRYPTVLRTAVPKATVHEDRYFARPEDQVGSPSQVG